DNSTPPTFIRRNSMPGWLTERARGRIFTVLALFMFLSGTRVFARGRKPPAPWPRYQGWVAYFRGEDGLQALEIVQPALESVSVFALQFNSQGQLISPSPWVDDTLTKLKAGPKPPFIWLTVVNDVKGEQENILKDPQMIHNK